MDLRENVYRLYLLQIGNTLWIWDQVEEKKKQVTFLDAGWHHPSDPNPQAVTLLVDIYLVIGDLVPLRLNGTSFFD